MIGPVRKLAWMAVLLTLAVVSASGLLSAAASALTVGPGWEATVRSLPTNFAPGGEGLIQVDVYDIGAAPSSGVATVTDVLPTGLTFAGSGDNYDAGAADECAPSTLEGVTTVTCDVQPFG